MFWVAFEICCLGMRAKEKPIKFVLYLFKSILHYTCIMLLSMISFYLSIDVYEKLLLFRLKYLVEFDCEIMNVLVLIKDTIRENIERNNKTREKIVKLVTKKFVRMCVKKESPSTKLVSGYLETICIFPENYFHAGWFFECFIDLCYRYHINGKEECIARQNLLRDEVKTLSIIGKSFGYANDIYETKTLKMMSIIIGNLSVNMLHVVLSALDVTTNLANINNLIEEWKKYPFEMNSSDDEFINNWRNIILNAVQIDDFQSKIRYLCRYFDVNYFVGSECEWSKICLFLCQSQCSTNTKIVFNLTDEQWELVRKSLEGEMVYQYSIFSQ
jgi:hypothetical protein